MGGKEHGREHEWEGGSMGGREHGWEGAWVGEGWKHGRNFVNKLGRKLVCRKLVCK